MGVPGEVLGSVDQAPVHLLGGGDRYDGVGGVYNSNIWIICDICQVLVKQPKSLSGAWIFPRK